MADNAAGRLRQVFARIDGAGASQALSVTIGEIFGLSDEDLAGRLRKVAEIVDLVSLVRAQVQAADELDPGVLLQHYGEIENAIRTFSNLDQVTQQFQQRIQGTGWHTLDICASLLQKRAREPQLQDGRAADLLAQVREVIEQVRNADDLSSEDKRTILHHLLAVEDALQNIWLLGVDGLQDAVDRMGSALTRRPNLLARLGESTTVEGFFRVVAAVDLALRLATGPLALPAADHTPPPKPSHTVTVLAEEFGYQIPEAPTLSAHSDEEEVVEAEIIDDDPGATG
jgi:hypothetical protein